MADLLVLPRPAKSMQNNASFSEKILGLLKRKKWPQCHRESSWQVRRSRLCQKQKERSRLSRVPDRKVGESRDERKHGVERVDSTGKEGSFQEGEGGQATRASLEEVEGSMSG